MKKVISFCLISLAFQTFSVAQEGDEDWHFNISPYLYIPVFGGDIHFTLLDQDQTLEMEVNPGDYLDKLSFALMINGEVKKGRWSAAYDLFAFDIEADASYVESISFDIDNPIPGRPPIEVGVDVDAGTEFDFIGRQNTLAVGYRLVNNRFLVNSVAGVRWISLKSRLDWRFNTEINGPDGLVINRSGSESVGSDLWQAILGIRGSYFLTESEKWSTIYYLDVGTGDTKFTWQGILGLSYNTKLIDYKLVYRHIQFVMKEDRVFDNLYFSGASFGLTIKL